MGMVGIKVASWQGLSATNKQRLRTVTSRVGLGQPVTLLLNGTEYFCFDDERLGVTTADLVARVPQADGHVLGVDGDWSTAVPKES